MSSTRERRIREGRKRKAETEVEVLEEEFKEKRNNHKSLPEPSRSSLEFCKHLNKFHFPLIRSLFERVEEETDIELPQKSKEAAVIFRDREVFKMYPYSFFKDS